MATPDPDSKFPPGAWLGYGIDLTSANPTDIKSVRNYSYILGSFYDRVQPAN